MNLSSLQTKSHKFTIAAFDHRSSLAKMLGIDAGSDEGQKQIREVKTLFMKTFSPMCSAVLTDPIYGKESLEFKDKSSGLLMSLEQSGYDGGKAVVPPLVENWGIDGVKINGSAAKLLLYFHPEEENAEAKISLVKKLYEEAKEKKVIFLLEPVVYQIEKKEKDFVEEYETLQQKTVQALTNFCHVLKLEYPGVHSENDDVGFFACKVISQIVSVPWILLSRGMKFNDFRDALKRSMQAGASGFAVGRAVWQEIEDFSLQKTHDWTESRQKIEHFLNTIGKERMKELVEIVG